MARFPLDGAFAELRKVVEEVTVALRQWAASMGAAPRSAGRGSASGASVDGLPRSQDQAAASSKRLGDAVARTSIQLNGLQRAAHGAGELAKILGFEAAGKQIETFSKGLGAVKDLMSGIVSAARPLAAIGAVVGVVLGALGSMQEAIRRGTGETLSLMGIVRTIPLGLVRAATDGFASLRQALNSFVVYAELALRPIASFLSRPIADAVAAIGRMQVQLGGAFRNLPGLEEESKLLEIIGIRTQALAGNLRSAAEPLTQGQILEKTAALGRANKDIADAAAAAIAGLDEQINKIMDGSQGTSMADNPLGALLEFVKDLKKEMEGLIGGGGEKPGGVLAPSGGAFSAGQGVGQEYVSGIEGALGQMAPQINQQIVDALMVDPDDETKIVSSFSDLLKNIGNLFKSNPLAFVLGGGGGGGGGGGDTARDNFNWGHGGGFATGGRVGSGGSPSWAHFAAGVRGFAAGGRALSDTVAAWLTPGEWVMRLSAVRQYGDDVMSRINAGLVDPGELRAVAAGPHGGGGSGGPGYASGGQVGAGGGAATVLPMLVATEANAEAIFAAGRTSLLRLMRDSPGDFRGSLGL